MVRVEAFDAPMFVKRRVRAPRRTRIGQSGEYFPGYVALETPDDLALGEPFGRPSSHVVPGGFVVSEAHDVIPGAIVGHDPLHTYSLPGEPGHGSAHEADARLGLFV